MEKGNKIILVMGIIAMAAAVFSYFESSAFHGKASETQGRVVHVLGSSYRISYTTAEGNELVYQGSGKTHGFREGDAVNIWYRNDKPAKVRFNNSHKGAKMLGGIAAFCIIMGLYPLFLRKK